MADMWEKWFKRVESIGFCAQYRKTLSESFDSREQLEAVYVRESPEGRVLDAKFFEDIGVRHAEHQRHFKRWLCGEGVASRISSDAAEPRDVSRRGQEQAAALSTPTAEGGLRTRATTAAAAAATGPVTCSRVGTW